MRRDSYVPEGTYDLFYNRAGRLRSGWRFLAFVIAFLVGVVLLVGMMQLALVVPGVAGFFGERLEGNSGFIIQGLLLLIPATLAGWGCNRVLEDLPRRALGWTFHRGWFADTIIGVVLGSLSLSLAVFAGVAFGSFQLKFDAAAMWPAMLRTLVASGLIFALSAAAEEALFRGYPLQTFARSLPAWLAVIPSSLLFASVHLLNPNTVRGFTFFNTALAGVWLAVAYLRTRSLWFPLGLHWGWNWTMGALLGLPVSGITEIAPAPLMRATDHGPAWLTGGDYGIEGGVACTLALVLSTIFIRRTRLLAATEELQRMTDDENPDPPAEPLMIRES